MHKKQLEDITKIILNSTSIAEEISAVRSLSVFFQNIILKEHSFHSKKNEVITTNGIAISSFDAAICLDEHIRTARFLKGVSSAIKELQIRFPGQKITILYAGCGPYAPLLLPLLSVLDPDNIEAILLDINSESIDSVNNILSVLEPHNYKIQTLQADAITYKKPESWPMHLLISETMFEALTREPQVAITMNLVPQLISNGILIPEEINIDLAYTFFAKEPFLKSETNETVSPECFNLPEYQHRKIVDQLFSLNKELNFLNELEDDPHVFESKDFDIPKDELRPDICIFTRLKIFGDIELDHAQSNITNPHCIISIHPIIDSSSIRLIYHFKGTPHWTYELKG